LTEDSISRRDFVKAAAVGAVAMAVSSTGTLWLLRPKVSLQRPNRVVADPTYCAGCRICELVCATSHDAAFASPLTRIQVDRNWSAGEWGGGVFVQDFCRQCPNPECYFACPVGAITFDPNTGARIIDQATCRGCKRCLDACPYHVVSFDEERILCLKCDLCQGDPLCVKYCPTGALKYVVSQ
jgi:Fe-S-cluster-containing hydrogenase component 2